MITSSEFLALHTSLLNEIKTKYEDDYAIVASENELQQSDVFPVIGMFLGASTHCKETPVYAPLYYAYVLSCFNEYDIDTPSDLKVKQHSTYLTIMDVIAEMGYNVLTDIEPVISIGTNFGFITGWVTTIMFQA